MIRPSRRLPPLLVPVLASLGLLATACNRKSEAPAPADAARTAEILAALPAPYNTADIANGRQTFQLCSACHTAIEGGANMTGPNLYGVFGRKAASVTGYAYSPALKAAGWVWTPEKLDQWLTSPQTTLPGSKMSFVGVKDAKARTDLIAYLHLVSSGGPS